MIIPGHQLENLFQFFRPHQAKGRIDIFHANAEDQKDDQLQRFSHYNPIQPVLAAPSGSKQQPGRFPVFPQRPEFLRQRLPVGIRLENIIGAVADGVMIAKENRRTVSAVFLGYSHQAGTGLLQMPGNVQRMILAAVIHQQQPGILPRLIHDRMPLPDHRLDIFFLVVCRNDNPQIFPS